MNLVPFEQDKIKLHSFTDTREVIMQHLITSFGKDEVRRRYLKHATMLPASGYRKSSSQNFVIAALQAVAEEPKRRQGISEREVRGPQKFRLDARNSQRDMTGCCSTETKGRKSVEVCIGVLMLSL